MRLFWLCNVFALRALCVLSLPLLSSLAGQSVMMPQDVPPPRPKGREDAAGEASSELGLANPMANNSAQPPSQTPQRLNGQQETAARRTGCWCSRGHNAVRDGGLPRRDLPPQAIPEPQATSSASCSPADAAGSDQRCLSPPISHAAGAGCLWCGRGHSRSEA